MPGIAQGSMDYLLLAGAAVLLAASVIALLAAVPASITPECRVLCLQNTSFGQCEADRGPHDLKTGDQCLCVPADSSGKGIEDPSHADKFYLCSGILCEPGACPPGGCTIDFSAINGNLVQNPYAECDNDMDEMPDGWKAFGADTEHLLSWEEGPAGSGNNSKVLKSQFTGNGIGKWGLRWEQEIPNKHPITGEVLVEPDTWYEFSLSFATQGLEPVIDPNTNIMKSSSRNIGVAVQIKDKQGKVIPQSRPSYSFASFWSQGPKLADWDGSVWAYRRYETKGFEGWRSLKAYFLTPPEAHSILIRTYNFPKGEGYFDSFVLRKAGQDNPGDTSFKKAGFLEFMQHNVSAVFPIVLWGYPKQGGQEIEIGEIKGAGFNTVGFSAGGLGYRRGTIGNEQFRGILAEEGLLLAVAPPRILWKSDPNPGNVKNWQQRWVYDPSSQIDYTGAGIAKGMVDEWAGFENLLFFMGSDETNCHPERDASHTLNLKPFEEFKDYIKNANQAAKVYYNFCGNKWPYTGLPEDNIGYFFGLTDAITFTCNTPAAYPTEISTVPALGRMGETIRWAVEKGEGKTVLGMGLGVHWWSNWDGKGGSNYIPFNLQRFQVFDHIINGATGVFFHIGGGEKESINLEDNLDRHHWEQMKAIAKELDSLEDVLLEPEFFDEWDVSEEGVEIMMKKHDGKIYLLAASTHYEDLHDVIITLDSKYKINTITALNEVEDGSIVLLSDHIFTDDFVGDYGATPGQIDSPGYAVHVYEIEYS